MEIDPDAQSHLQADHRSSLDRQAVPNVTADRCVSPLREAGTTDSQCPAGVRSPRAPGLHEVMRTAVTVPRLFTWTPQAIA